MKSAAANSVTTKYQKLYKNSKSDTSCIPGTFSDKVIPDIDLVDIKNNFLDDDDILMITNKF